MPLLPAALEQSSKTVSPFQSRNVTPAGSRFLCLMGGLATALLMGVPARGDHPIPFDVRVLTVDLNEGCDIADFDGDGKLDVVAGRNWYHNPDWIPRPVRTIEENSGYACTNGDFAYDVRGSFKTSKRLKRLAGNLHTMCVERRLTWSSPCSGDRQYVGPIEQDPGRLRHHFSMIPNGF